MFSGRRNGGQRNMAAAVDGAQDMAPRELGVKSVLVLRREREREQNWAIWKPWAVQRGQRGVVEPPVAGQHQRRVGHVNHAWPEKGRFHKVEAQSPTARHSAEVGAALSFRW